MGALSACTGSLRGSIGVSHERLGVRTTDQPVSSNQGTNQPSNTPSHSPLTDEFPNQ